MGYLVISRRVGERILLNDNIEIFISDIYRTRDGNLKVDIAIDAPRNVKILKKETHMQDLKNGLKHRN